MKKSLIALTIAAALGSIPMFAAQAGQAGQNPSGESTTTKKPKAKKAKKPSKKHKGAETTTPPQK